MSSLYGHAIGATDGPVGRIADLRVDTARWAVCAAVVDAGAPVLISPRLLGDPDDARRIVPTPLTRAQVAASPHPDTDRLGRSARDLAQHFALGLDEEIGPVVGLLVEDRSWVVRHLLVALDQAPAPRAVAVPVGWVSWVSTEARAVMLALQSEQVRHAPAYDESGVRPADDGRLAAHYGRPPFAAER